MFANGRIVQRLVLADSVEKLLFRSYSKNSRAAEASLLLGCGGPCNLLLRGTRTVLTSAATIRRVNCLSVLCFEQDEPLTCTHLRELRGAHHCFLVSLLC